jgi:hypothetical protein
MTDRTELQKQLYDSLVMYPCRCIYVRATNGQPLFKEGKRVLEKQCSRCAAIASYEEERRLHG